MGKGKAKQRAAVDKCHHGNYYYYTDQQPEQPAEEETDPDESTDAGTLENFELLKEMAESDNN